MKRRMFALISILLLLGLTACTAAPQSKDPEASTPEERYDLAYDMQDYDFFSEIFEEKSLDEWKSMGCYTMLLTGLHTPVVVTMDGTDVLTVGAYDQTVELGEEGLANDYHDGLSPVSYIGTTQDTVVIRVSGGESSDHSMLITEDRCYTFREEQESNINFYIRQDGTLEYYRLWKEPMDFEQMGYDFLATITDRNERLYETGRAEIVDRDLVFTAEKTVTLSEEFDLDTLFAEAKEAGRFEEYETLDALLAANQARAD